MDRQNRSVGESGETNGLEEADEVCERSRLKALCLAALRRLREREANRRDQDLVRRHRRAAVELKKLAVDSGRTPGRVLGCHLPNEPSNLGLGSRAPGLRLPSPEESKRLAMPRDDSLWPDHDQTLPPLGEELKDEGPESSVPRGQGKMGRLRPQEDAELMPQREVLGHDCSPRRKRATRDPRKSRIKPSMLRGSQSTVIPSPLRIPPAVSSLRL